MGSAFREGMESVLETSHHGVCARDAVEALEEELGREEAALSSEQREELAARAAGGATARALARVAVQNPWAIRHGRAPAGGHLHIQQSDDNPRIHPGGTSTSNNSHGGHLRQPSSDEPPPDGGGHLHAAPTTTSSDEPPPDGRVRKTADHFQRWHSRYPLSQT